MVRCWLGLVLVLLLPNFVRGDGKIFSEVAHPITTIPDQQAIIGFENGIERLTINTSYQGEGTNFAWVVPLTAAPKIEAADANDFSTLRKRLEPELRHDVTRFYLVVAVAGLTIFLAAKSIARTDNELHDVPICFIVALLVGFNLHSAPWAIAIFGISLLVRWFVRSPANLLVVPFLYFFAYMGVSVIMPQDSVLVEKLGFEYLGESGSSVDVLERAQVGAYDTATIASTNSQAIVQWLQDNGFAVPQKSQPVFAEYTKQGWVFAAMRIHRDETRNAVRRPHPLMFTFATKEPVYPMRLTGVENGKCRIELYVYGAEKAAAKNFSVAECRTTDGIRFQHTFANANVITKLVSDLRPSQMKSDYVIKWKPYDFTRTVLYSTRGALIMSANLFSVMALLAVGGVATMRDSWGMTPSSTKKLMLRAAAICMAIAVFIFCLLPKTDFVLERF
jgi:hypothetical protein